MKTNKSLILMTIFFVLLAYNNYAAGQFNVPLSWVLMPNGSSVDDDNDGTIDEGGLAGDLTCTDCVDGSDLADTITLDATLAISQGSYDINFDANTLFVSGNTNKVGIGTTNPLEALTIIGNVNVSGMLNATAIYQNGNAVLDASTSWGGDLTGTGSSPAIANDKVQDDEIDYSAVTLNDFTNDRIDLFNIGNMTGVYANFTELNVSGQSIFTSGNVGIGTTTPTEKLVVIGSVNISDSLNVSGTVQATTFIGDGSLLSGISTDFTNNSDINVTNFVANNTLFVSGSRVGIGTVNPGSELEVVGNVNITGNVTAVSYKKNCPSGYVPVPHDNIYTFEDFCVMKYEAKNSGGDPVSQTSGNPWVSIYQYDARAECESLGENYHLITNAEWMTIGTNIAKQASNWNSTTVGTGPLVRGFSASTGDDGFQNSAVAPSTGSGYEYNTGANTVGATPTAGKDYLRRTFYLSNGEIIWDFAGNVREWNDEVVNVAERPHVGGKDYGWQEFSVLNVSKGVKFNELSAPYQDDFLNSSYGAGRVYTTQGITGGQKCYTSIAPAGYRINACAFRRGGDWGDGADAGVFALYLNSAPSYSDPGLGFRCGSS